VTEPAELRLGLEHALSEQAGAERRIASLERRSSPFQTSFTIEELHVALDDGSTLELVFKDSSREALSARAREARPSFLDDPLREIETYRLVLGPAGLGTPTFHGAWVDPEHERYWLFIEKVAGTELWQVGEVTTWEEVARRLAAIHEQFAGEIERPEVTQHLVRYDGAFYRGWLERALKFSRADRRSELERLAHRYDAVVERLLDLPPAFIHGEFYASNVLIRDGSGLTCPIDWERAAIGPGLIDLAALTTGKWSNEIKARLAKAYRDALAAPGSSLDEEAFALALDCCRLHLAVQWLGWAPGSWRPPRKHRQDWLGEALRLAEKLGL
jgi:aminoglycoside phosphotransferase (APT) family kinase protein